MRLFFMFLASLFIVSFSVPSFAIDEKNVPEQDSLRDRSSGSGNDRRVAEGWNLIKRWDFYKKSKDWVVSNDNRSKGRLTVAKGILEFGNGKSMLYYPNKLKIKAKTTYLIIARVRINEPLGASIGFYNPKTKGMMGETRIRKGDWHIVKALISIDPISGDKKPKRLYPAIQTQSKDEIIEIDWIELWIFPRTSAAAARNAKRFDLLFKKKR